MFDYWSDPSHIQASRKGKEMKAISEYNIVVLSTELFFFQLIEMLLYAVMLRFGGHFYTSSLK